MSTQTKREMSRARLALFKARACVEPRRVLLRLVLVAAAFIPALAPVFVHAEDDNSKKLALIHLLVRSGKYDAAADAMRSIYPKGPPSSGEAALDYYDIIGNTDQGWDEAKKGLEGLVKAAPGNVHYRLALARHLTRSKATHTQGMQMFAALAKPQGADRQKVLEEWRRALDNSPPSIDLYQDYLAQDPDNASVREMLAAAERFEAKHMPWKLRARADAQVNAGHPDEALETLKKALKLDPANAWVRFDLSRLYHKQGDKKQGRALMAQGLSVAPDDPDMLYANALYLSLLDEPENALHLLDKIPAQQRSPATLRLRQKMAIQAQTQKAQALAHEGKRPKMQAAMERAEADATGDAELTNIVANAWLDLNDPARGVALMQHLAARPAAPVATRMYYAELLNRAENDQELGTVLEKLAGAPGLAASDKNEVRYLQSVLAARRTDNLRHAGNLAAAKSQLVAALKQDPENYDMLMALARVHLAAKEPKQACDIYQGILRRTPGDTYVRRALVNALLDAGDKAAAQHEMATLVANLPANDLENRVAAGDWYLGIGDVAGARPVVEQSKKLAPHDARVLVQAGTIAQADGNYPAALDNFLQAKGAGGDIGDEGRRLVWQMRDKADQQLGQGHPEAAVDTLQKALQLDPKNAWARFDLSRIYHKRGDVKQGRALMEEGLSVAPDDADLLYANALYVSLLDEPENALRLLEKIPDPQRSPAMQRLHQQVMMEVQLRETDVSAQHAKAAAQ